MNDIIEILKTATPGVIIVAVFAYFLKIYFEKKVEALGNRLGDIDKMSLDIKKSLRDEERNELVNFRVAVEKWEYFLQTYLYDYTMMDAVDSSFTPFYNEEKQLYLDVKIAILKSSIYLRNRELEQKLMNVITDIRKTYSPFINEIYPSLIEIQAKLIPIQTKMANYQKSGFTDNKFAPSEEDRIEHLNLQNQMTAEVKKFSERVIKEYPKISEQMFELKESVNEYIYRPVNTTDLNEK